MILISLNYDVIEYAERTYPEFDTGTLVFADNGIKKFLNGPADLIITDHIDLAEAIQTELDRRSDLEIIQDVLGRAFR